MLKHDSNQSIIMMPESEGNTLCVEHSGLVNADDHGEFLHGNLDRIIKEYGSFNLLVFYRDDYLGYTPEAADSSIRSILDFGGAARKLAYVNPPEAKIRLHKMLPKIFTGEVRFFDKDQLPDAFNWVKS